MVSPRWWCVRKRNNRVEKTMRKETDKRTKTNKNGQTDKRTNEHSTLVWPFDFSRRAANKKVSLSAGGRHRGRALLWRHQRRVKHFDGSIAISVDDARFALQLETAEDGVTVHRRGCERVTVFLGLEGVEDEVGVKREPTFDARSAAAGHNAGQAELAASQCHEAAHYAWRVCRYLFQEPVTNCLLKVCYLLLLIPIAVTIDYIITYEHNETQTSF